MPLSQRRGRRRLNLTKFTPFHIINLYIKQVLNPKSIIRIKQHCFRKNRLGTNYNQLNIASYFISVLQNLSTEL